MGKQFFSFQLAICILRMQMKFPSDFSLFFLSLSLITVMNKVVVPVLYRAGPVPIGTVSLSSPRRAGIKRRRAARESKLNSSPLSLRTASHLQVSSTPPSLSGMIRGKLAFENGFDGK